MTRPASPLLFLPACAWVGVEAQRPTDAALVGELSTSCISRQETGEEILLGRLESCSLVVQGPEGKREMSLLKPRCGQMRIFCCETTLFPGLLLGGTAFLGAVSICAIWLLELGGCAAPCPRQVGGKDTWRAPCQVAPRARSPGPPAALSPLAFLRVLAVFRPECLSL